MESGGLDKKMKPFKCSTCDMRFAQKGNLNIHERVKHKQEKRFQCELCGKAFKFKRLLDGHIMSNHTGDRPYSCEVCKLRFVYSQHYKQHKRIHTGEKPFSCEICGRTFNSSNNRRVHMFIHSDKMQYECRVCGTGYKRKPMVMLHIDREHSEINNVEENVICNSPSIIKELVPYDDDTAFITLEETESETIICKSRTDTNKVLVAPKVIQSKDVTLEGAPRVMICTDSSREYDRKKSSRTRRTVHTPKVFPFGEDVPHFIIPPYNVGRGQMPIYPVNR